MRRDILIAAVCGALGVSATPLAKRQSSGLTDADILNFALVLEHLEATFYAQALSKFDASAFTSAGYASNIRANIEQIAMDEAQHVQFLTTALSAAGATPVSACNYTFGFDSVTGFLGLSQVLEGVGVSAYLGAAQYIQNPAYLTAAGSILTAEARHNAFIRYINGYSPFVTEDTPLDPTAVTSLAAPFISSCPSASDAPPFKPFPAANLTSNTTTPGSTIQVSFANSSSIQDPLYCLFFSGLENSHSTYANGSCMIPTANATSGQAYGVISKSMTFNDSNVVAGPFVLQFDTKNNTASGSSKTGSVSNNAAETKSTGAGFKTQAAAGGLSVVLAAVGSFFLF